MILNYIKIAFRRLLREKQYVVTNLVGLTVGMTACILIGLYVHHELSYDRYHQDADRIYRVLKEHPNREGFMELSFDKNFSAEISEGVPDVEEVVTLSRHASYQYLKRDDEQYRDLDILVTPSSFFDLFTHPLVYGNTEEILDRPNTIALGEETARQIFGDVNPVGESVMVIQRSRGVVEEVPMEITGVYRDVPDQSHFHFDAAISYRSLDPGNYMLNHYIKLEAGSSPETAERRIDEASSERYGDRPVQHKLQPITDIYLGEYAAQRRGDIQSVYLFSAIALLILIIAIMNYVNLSTARGELRAKEVGIRKVSGASRSALIRQFMGEAVVYAFMVIPLVLLLIELLLPHFNQLMSVNLHLSLLENVSLAMVLMLVVAGAGMVSGIYPSLVLSSFQPAQVLKGNYSGAVGGSGFRKGLIVAQFVISCGLILTTLVIIQQMNFMQDKDLGYDGDRVVQVSLGSSSDRPHSEIIRDRFLENPVVKTASLSNGGLPSLGGMFADISRQDSSNISVDLTYGRVGTDFIPMMGISMAAGSNFREEVVTDLEGGVILNESAVNSMGWSTPGDAIGERVRANNGSVRTILGVVHDFHTRSLHDQIESIALFAQYGSSRFYNTLNLKVKPGHIGEAIASLEETWNNVVPGIAFNYSFLDEKLRQLYEQEQRTYSLFTAFASLAIVLACLGLFGLATYASQRRTREIGIRKVLGASISRILVLLSRDFTLLVLAGFAVSVPIAWYFTQQWLQQFAYRIEPGLGTILITGVLALAIAVLTVSWKSLDAATANPVDSLRSE